MDVGSHFVPFSPIYAPQFHLYAEIWANLLLIRISLLPHSHLLNGCSSQRVRRRKGLYEHYGISLQTKGREREKKAYKYIQTEEGDFESIRLCREPGPTRREKMCLLENDLQRGGYIYTKEREAKGRRKKNFCSFGATSFVLWMRYATSSYRERKKC